MITTPRLNRRSFLRIGATGVVLPPLSVMAQSSGKQTSNHPFASFDQVMNDFMIERKVPGGALAVVKDRRLVYARGYGWANREQRIAVQPTSLFRIASISKPFTAVAVLKLVEQGKVSQV